ncbi:MAG: HPr family phosphocarrier protein [Clostridia bacterium]|nr:HPr family phosphocarrier protein [Clostridia bacterium]
MKIHEYRITDENGIHARPAGRIVQAAKGFVSHITIIMPQSGKSADAKKLFAVMGLGAKKNDLIRVEAEGEDESAAVEAMAAVLQDAGL